MRVHQNGASAQPGDTSMSKKIIIALFAALALFASFETGANAQGSCEEGHASAYARPRC
jgi:hypothetical protein